MDCRPRLEASICPGYCYTDSVNSYTESVTQVSYVGIAPSENTSFVVHERNKIRSNTDKKSNSLFFMLLRIHINLTSTNSPTVMLEN